MKPYQRFIIREVSHFPILPHSTQSLTHWHEHYGRTFSAANWSYLNIVNTNYVLQFLSVSITMPTPCIFISFPNVNNEVYRTIYREWSLWLPKWPFSSSYHISQAFDKVWHAGLLYKLRQTLPLNYFLLLKSYLHNRHFRVKVGNDYSELTSIHAGVP
jgi:hypothetical protein